MKLRRCDMASGVTKSGVKVNVLVTEDEFNAYLLNSVLLSDKFKPAWVANDSDHALYIEFGTNGAHFSGPASKNKGISPVELDIRDWVEKKLQIRGPARDKVAHRVYRKIMSEGIPPQPYLRPAVNNVMQELSSEPDWFGKDDHSVLKIAEMIAEEMKRILNENGTPFTGDIVNKIHVYPDAGDRPLEPSYPLRDMPQNVLSSLTADLNGDENRAAEAKKRRRKRC